MSTLQGLAGPVTRTTSLLRLATAGSVDDGKSTLVGRLLHDSKNVLADQLDALERLSAERGLDGADLALLTDGLRAEREQGITIDVAYRYFSTGERAFILADCPGHVQYTRNTVTGASTADAILVLVDVRKGVLDQTRRHLAVASLLRVPHVVVAVNKIDLVDFDEATYLGVAAQVAELAEALGIERAVTVPTSALAGDNVVERSDRTPWYAGPALLELLEQLPPAEAVLTESLRFGVQRVIRPQSAALEERYREYRGYAGRISAGVARPGDEVVVLPSGVRTRIAGVDTPSGELPEAVTGRSVTIRLADDVDVTRGDVIAAAADAPPAVTEAEAMLCWLAEVPLRGGQRVLLKHGSATVQAIVTQLHGRLDLDELKLHAASAFDLNDIGRVALRLARPLPLEDYRTSRSGGAFVLIDPVSGGTLAAGMAREPGRAGGIEWEI